MNSSDSFEGLSDITNPFVDRSKVTSKSLEVINHLLEKVGEINPTQSISDDKIEPILNMIEQISQICDLIYVSLYEMAFMWLNIVPKLKSQSSPEASIVHHVVKLIEEINKRIRTYVYRDNTQNYMDGYLYRKSEIIGRSRLELNEAEKATVIHQFNRKMVAQLHADLIAIKFMFLELHGFITHNRDEI